MISPSKKSLILNVKLFIQSKSNTSHNSAQWIKKPCKGLSRKIQAISIPVTSFQSFAKIILSLWLTSTLRKFLFVESHPKIMRKWTKSSKKSNNYTKYFTTENPLHNYNDKFNSNIFLKNKENSSHIMTLWRMDRKMILQDANGENKTKEFYKTL